MRAYWRTRVKALPGYQQLRRWHETLATLGAREQQWARVVMDGATLAWVADLQPDRLDALEISGTAWRERMRFKTYQSVHYPEFDVCASGLNRTFDLVIAEQVFEHVLWPYRAGRNVYTMLREGGHFLITTPFLVRLHNQPDCSRWTETGMRHFLAECGFDFNSVQTGSWGNRACVRANFRRWIGYRPWLHSLRNEPDFPVTVWALARK
jgi:SAM-dependent methyltransferase